MGSGISVEPDTESPTVPGEKVCLTSEITEVSHDELVEGVFDFLRQPMHPPEAVPFIKSTEITDVSESEFVVKVVLDGEKLKAQSEQLSPEGKDKVIEWMRVQHLPAESMFITESYCDVVGGGSFVDECTEGVVLNSTNTRILKDPLRLEYWVVMKGEKTTNAEVAQYLGGIIGPIVQLSKKKIVSFFPDKDSVAEPGHKSILSEPMDEKISADALWDALIDVKKEFPEAQITTVSESEVYITGPDGVESPNGSLKMSWDKDAGKITRARSKGGKLLDTNYVVVHKDPLVMEVWMIDGAGQRMSGKMLSKVVANQVDPVIQRATSWFG